MTKILGLALTLAAYSDTALGLWLRIVMTAPVGAVDAPLAMYIVENLHF